MRVLVIGINYAPDLIGVAKYNTELCESLVARGHDVRVVTAPPYYPDWKIPSEYRSGWYSRNALTTSISYGRRSTCRSRPSGAKRLLHHASFLLSAAIPLLCDRDPVAPRHRVCGGAIIALCADRGTGGKNDRGSVLASCPGSGGGCRV